MARDAASSGDRVLSENFLQHADHYFRLVRSMQPAAPPPQQANERFSEREEAESDESVGEVEAGEYGEVAAEAGEQPDVDFPQGQQPQPFERDGEHRRRRGRRNRYRPNEGEGSEARDNREGGEREGVEGREDRRDSRDRQQRDREDNQGAGPEGFSHGPKPAFLRD
jgi:hypothetical protein